MRLFNTHALVRSIVFLVHCLLLVSAAFAEIKTRTHLQLIPHTPQSIELIQNDVLSKLKTSCANTRSPTTCESKGHIIIHTPILDKSPPPLSSTRSKRERPSPEPGSGSNAEQPEQRAQPTSRQLEYAKNHCSAESYARVVLVDTTEDLWAVVEEFSDTYSSDTWMQLDYTGQEWSWDKNPDHALGVLYLLPANAQYNTHAVVLYYDYWSESLRKIITPRIGLCSLSSEQPATLVNSGRGISKHQDEGFGLAPDGGIYVGALYIAQAQVEMYDVSIEGNQVDTRTSVIELHRGGKLFANNLTVSRTEGENLVNHAGLILALSLSKVRLHNASLSQTTTNGTLLYSDYSEVQLVSSNISAADTSYPMVTWSSDITLDDNELSAYSTGNDSPIALSSYDTEEAEEIKDYCLKPKIKECQSNPEGNIIVDGIFTHCSSYLDYCVNNRITMKNNRFLGSWETILWVLQDTYSEDSRGNSKSTFNPCATEDSGSLEGDPVFDLIGGCIASSQPEPATQIDDRNQTSTEDSNPLYSELGKPADETPTSSATIQLLSYIVMLLSGLAALVSF